MAGSSLEGLIHVSDKLPNLLEVRILKAKDLPTGQKCIFPYGARPARTRRTDADTPKPSAPVWRTLVP